MSDPTPSASPRPCPNCGGMIAADDANGLCGACLMAEVAKPTFPGSGQPKARWEPPTAEELAKLLPQYEITRMLGRGGMGAVYQGTQKSLDRTVAIKILSNDLETADASFAERFKNEAKAMAKLSHPGIVAVFDSGETANGLLYIVMEFIEGTDVAKMIAQQKRLHTEHAMAIAAHVCDALAYAHERGIIHRDIKPANIMVGYDGVVKVADFGLAKMSKGGESAGLTQSGMAMGTLHYMAPEALMLGSAVDHRADIYAVGVMLYQMLTGKVPHGMFELPSLQVPGLDPRYDGIISRAMREDREVRYQAAAELRHDLDAILTQPVVKVEAAAEKAPAALETLARPQRPGGKPYRPPQPEVIVRTEKKGSPLLWTAVVALAALAAWLYFQRSPSDAGAVPATTTASTPASVPVPEPVPAMPAPVTPTQEPPAATKMASAPTVAPLTSPPSKTATLPVPSSFVPQPPAPALPTGPTTWTDTQGRSITATFKAMASGNVLLDIAGKVTPVPLNTLSAESQKLARAYHGQATAAAAKDPAQATKDAPFVNSLGMKFVPVPGTKVLFCIHEVRYKDWLTYTSANGLGEPMRNDMAPVGAWITERAEEHPVKNVIYDDAVKFCQWLSKKEGKPYRLPSDQEWSHAVGIGQEEDWKPGTTPESRSGRLKDVFPWGNAWPPPQNAGNFKDKAWREVLPSENPVIEDYDDGFPGTAPVMSFKPNLLGIYDLGGNVTEWVQDWRNSDQKDRSIRGSAYGTSDRQRLFSSARGYLPPSTFYRNADTGIRVVLEYVPSTATASVPPAPTVVPPAISLAQATKDKAFTNTLGMKFVPVPGTKVLMCIHETRRGDYAKFAAETAGLDSKWRSTTDGDSYPVVFVNWHEAQAFCAWLTQKTGFQHRLPTDREWSFAVGIGDLEDEKETPEERSRKNKDRYPWGGSWPPPNDVGNYSDGGINKQFVARGINQQYADGHPGRAPVMQFKPNLLGLYDLGGNAWEWCEDWHNPTQSRRVLRGTSWWGSDASDLYSGRRLHSPPEDRSTFSDFGFRCVIELPVAAASAISPAVVPPAVPVPSRASVSAAAPASATKDVPFTNTLGMKFVPVPGTKVLFCIHETRYKDYALHASDAQGTDASWKDQSADGFTPSIRPEDHPVISVSWEDAQKFCAWLGKKEGKTYRLPTDEEWSHAVGIGQDEKWEKDTTPATVFKNLTAYPWGDRWPPPQGTGNFSDDSRKNKAPAANGKYLNNYDDGFPTTAPVMSYEPNKLGLYDLEGNVREWMEDSYDGSSIVRVLRGSSWLNYVPSYMLSSTRHRANRDFRGNSYGFRIVLELPQS